ncbi:MAG TPA: hypothetical protein VJB90_05105 [Candidatus Nanoarchaeia archaeon]|nr:hypothetical protein [Candidatus Nanoarchaeia archaeon]
MKKLISYLILSLVSVATVFAGSGNPLGPDIWMSAPTDYTPAPGEYLLGEEVTQCVTFTNNGTISHNVNPMLWAARVLETACGEDVTDSEPDYTEAELDAFHQSSCDVQQFLGIKDSHPYTTLNAGQSQQFCFSWVPPSPGYYQCDITGNVDGRGFDSYAWCFIRVSTEEIPEFSGIAAGLATAGAGLGFLMLRRRK